MNKFIVLLLSITAFLSCQKLENDAALEQRIKEAITSKNDSLLNLATLTNFDWDQLLIMAPYTNTGKVADSLNISLSSIRSSGIEYHDDVNLLVFLKQGSPVKMVESNRCPGDFWINGQFRLIPKAGARFRITTTNEKSSEGKDWIVLRQLP